MRLSLPLRPRPSGGPLRRRPGPRRRWVTRLRAAELCSAVGRGAGCGFPWGFPRPLAHRPAISASSLLVTARFRLVGTESLFIHASEIEMPLEIFCKAGKMNCYRYFCCDCELHLLSRSWALTGEMKQHGEKSCRRRLCSQEAVHWYYTETPSATGQQTRCITPVRIAIEE
ncbi:uncharacterized protein VK521_008924 [Ammospiza maritima maritima]